jgi:murein DD-endopeptidase MepM/ murein hydrolase activator NlpD
MTWSFSNRLIGLFAGLTPVPAAAAPPLLSLPVDCDLGRRCSIQKYVDHAAGPERQDYRCGTLTTDGHDGTDFRLRREADYRAGVNVLAAADGTVLRVRDGVADVSVRDPAATSVAGREAGNAVVIDHGEGWVTQYSHLMRGSVAVRPGARVRRGQAIGRIGLSGQTEYPHLHFEVRQQDRPVDPFARDFAGDCRRPVTSMWDDAARRETVYRDTVVLAAGLVDSPQMVTRARSADPLTRTVSGAPALILWASVTGIQPGDEQSFTIAGPSGDVILRKVSLVDKSALDWFAYAGAPRPGTAWPKGKYLGTYTLMRKGKSIGEASAAVTVE